MTSKRTRKAAASAESPVKPKATPVKPEAVNVQIVVEVPDDVATYYVNYAEITHSRHEFSIAVAKTPTKLSASRLEEALKTNAIRIDPVLQLIIPVSVMPGLIRACVTQREKYEAAYGKISEEGGGQEQSK